jgi:hypothetical protein
MTFPNGNGDYFADAGAGGLFCGACCQPTELTTPTGNPFTATPNAEAEEGYRGIGIAGQLEKKGGQRKNWKWRLVSFETASGSLRYYDGKDIDASKLKGQGKVCGVEDVEDRVNKRGNRFDIKIDHVERDTIDLLEVCTKTAAEKAHWMLAIKKAVNAVKLNEGEAAPYPEVAEQAAPAAVSSPTSAAASKSAKWAQIDALVGQIEELGGGQATEDPDTYYARLAGALQDRGEALSGTPKGDEAKHLLADVLVEQVQKRQKAGGETEMSRAEILAELAQDAEAQGKSATKLQGLWRTKTAKGEVAAARAELAKAKASGDAAAVQAAETKVAVEEEKAEEEEVSTRRAFNSTITSMSMRAADPAALIGKHIEVEGKTGKVIECKTKKGGSTLHTIGAYWCWCRRRRRHNHHHHRCAAAAAAAPAAEIRAALRDGRRVLVLPPPCLRLTMPPVPSTPLSCAAFDDGQTETIQLAKKPGAKGAVFHIGEDSPIKTLRKTPA